MPDTLTPEQMRHILRQWRGVRDPCPKCHGAGVRSYGSTSTWHGGMGGCAITKDVCDTCWGSGDEHRHGEDLRALYAVRKKWEEDEVFSYLAQRFGLTSLKGFRARFKDVADFCGKQANRRKIPEGEHEFWWHHEWSAIENIIRKLVGDAKKE